MCGLLSSQIVCLFRVAAHAYVCTLRVDSKLDRLHSAPLLSIAVRRAGELGEVHGEARWGCDPETDRDDWGVEPAVFDTKGVHQHKGC